MDSTSRPPIPALTGLRFFAALSVVIAHSIGKIVPYQAHPPAWQVALNALSAIGMPLFFVLSGFVIHYNYSERLRTGGPAGLATFFIARFARLYPLFACCLAFDLILKWAYYQLPDTTLAALPRYLTMTQTWKFAILGDRSLIFQFGTMPQIAWSISTEWFFYCVYPVVCYVLVQRMRSVGRLAGGALVTAAALVVAIAECINTGAINAAAVARYGPVADMASRTGSSFWTWLTYFSPYAQIPAFILGCIAAALFMQLRERPVTAREARLGLAATLVALIAIAAAFVLYRIAKQSVAADPLPFLGIALAPAIAVLLFGCARYDNAVVRFLSARPLLVCGEASYSLYLLHVMVVDAFRWEAAPVSDGRVLMGDGLRLVLTIATAIGLSLVTYRIIELPARRRIVRILGARIATARRPSANAASVPSYPAPTPAGAAGAHALQR